MRATNENPIYSSSRLESLTSWDASWEGLRVVVAGLGVSGFSAADTLIELGAEVLVIDNADTEENRSKVQTLKIVGLSDALLSDDAMDHLPLVNGQLPELIVTSPGLRPQLGLFVEAQEHGVQVWGDVELAWRLNTRRGRKTPQWLCITGTNGKTTTVGMTESILQQAGYRAVAVGNVGIPILDALRDPVEYDYFAVELSSFQLHWSYSMSPLASVVLNVAEDHVDWHEGYENYLADKARIYENTQVACIFHAEHQNIIRMVEEADVREGCRAIGFHANSPALSMLGVVEGLLVDRAFTENRQHEALELAEVADTGALPTKHTVENALAAAALCRAAGVPPEAVKRGLKSFEPGAHRIQPVAHTHSVLWVNDSKATNPHAAHASLSSFDSVVWIAGGLSKGVDYEELVRSHVHRLKAVIIIGTDTLSLRDALSKHAPSVPLYNVTDELEESASGAHIMSCAVAKAYEIASEKDTVLMAPAAASMDQFKSYADRGDCFIEAVTQLVEKLSSTENE
ncbi:UDP-N-acetylmuramoyl-L-alanine--D-glutamate ligase [Rothia sp. CCM 9418]|uniref:UDP-N-acetylmuramoyl-L-alanine--D-glutamate ligase n=1 Tax=Rothia sp. CCM 9418 TaxID=3402661 RepID=UPI003AEAAADA